MVAFFRFLLFFTVASCLLFVQTLNFFCPSGLDKQKTRAHN